MKFAVLLSLLVVMTSTQQALADYIEKPVFIDITDKALSALDDIEEELWKNSPSPILIKSEQRLYATLSLYDENTIKSDDESYAAQLNIIRLLRYVDDYCREFIATDSIDSKGRHEIRTSALKARKIYINYKPQYFSGNQIQKPKSQENIQSAPSASEKKASSIPVVPNKSPKPKLPTMKLLKAGPVSAVVQYGSQSITVRKYSPSSDEPLFGQSTDMGYLQPCIGSLVGAIVDDRNGEILSLVCTNGMPVLVVPDEYLKGY